MSDRIPVEPSTTQRRTHRFRQSMNQMVKKEKLTELDQWVDLSVKIVQLILIVIAFIAAVPLLTTLQLPLTLASSLVAIFLTLVFEVGYKYSIIRNALDIRIQMVTFAFFLLSSGSFSGVLLLFSLLSNPELVILFAILGFVSWIIVSGIVWTRVIKFISERVRRIISSDFHQFEGVISYLSMRFVTKARTSATQVTGLIFFVMIVAMNSINDITSDIILLLFVILIFGLLVLGNFFRFNSFVASIDLLWEYGTHDLTFDLLTYCVNLKELLQEKGIHDYDVVFSKKACIDETELRSHFMPEQVVTPHLLLPVGQDRVLVISRASDIPDTDKVQRILDETWTAGCVAASQTAETIRTGRLSLGLLPPFYIPSETRVILDEKVMLRPDVAWISGKPCFGVILTSEDLERFATIVGDVT